MSFLLPFSWCFALASAAAPEGNARAAEPISLEQAVERVQRETDGRVLATEEVDVGKRKVYRIKVLTKDGSVRRVVVAADGRDEDMPGKNDSSGKNAKPGKGK
jgi:uncharacterized membrane protein YkoI